MFYSNIRHRKAPIASLLVLACLVLFPLLGDDYLIAMLTQFIIYGVFAMGLSLVWGYTGILCFGHAVFFGLGAYIMALATKNMIPGIPGILTTCLGAILLALVAVTLFAVILGYFLFYGRLSGPYLGIVTLAIAVISERIAVKWYYIGGFNGLINVPPLSVAGWEIYNFKILFYVREKICIYFIFKIQVLIVFPENRLVKKCTVNIIRFIDRKTYQIRN